MGFVTVILFLIVACAPKEKIQITASPTSGMTTSLSKAEWEQKWEKLIVEAKKEGRLTISATGAAAPVREIIVKSFKSKYGIDLDFVFGPGPMETARISRERSGGIYNVDVAWNGASTALLQFKPANFLDKLEPGLILPEVIDEKIWLGGKLPWGDSDRTYFRFSAALQPIIINTNMISPQEIKSIHDILNPKLKGKIIMADPTYSGSASQHMMALGTGPQGWDFLRELLKQEPLIIGDVRQMTEWVAREKYWLGLGPHNAQTRYFQEAGAPVRSIVPDDNSVYLASWGSGLMLIKDAPHPNAARLFINWLLSREGQMLITKPYNTPSARLDIPNAELVDSASIPKPGVKYRDIDVPEYITKIGEYQKKVNEIFIPYMNKEKN